MKKVVTCFIFVLLLLTACLTLTPKNVSSKPEDVKISSYRYYIDGAGILDIIGEIQNTGTETLKEVVMTGIAYDSDGVIQCNSSYLAWVSYMAPQQKAPFLVELKTPANYTDWYSVDISNVDVYVSITNPESSHLYSDLAITVNSAGVSTNVDDKGTYWISGNVKNTGSQTASSLAVAAIFYNSLGDVVAVGHTEYLTPESLSPSESTSFKVGAFDTNQTAETANNNKITSYALFVQANSPVLQGDAPTATAQPTGSTSENSPPASQQSGASDDSANQNTIYIIIIAAVVIAVVAVLLSRIRH